jgi:chitodextrinase
MKKISYSLIFAGLLVVAWAINTKSAQAATLVLSPSTQSVTAGNTFTVSINLDTAGAGVYGVDIYSLHFNAALLQVQDSDSGTAGVQISPGALMANTQYNNVDNTNGVIQFSQTPAATSANYSGSGVLATVTFQAVAMGTASVTFDFTLNSTTDTNVAGLYTDLLTGVTNGSYTVTAAPDTTAPTVPAGLSATAVSSSAINLTWTASTDNVGVTGYKIFRCQGASCTATVQVGTSTIASFSDTGLSASTAYGYRIKAYDAAGNVSGYSSAASATTLSNADVSAPTVPTNLTGQVVSQTQINLSWSASTDPVVSGQITSGLAGYKIYRNGSQIATSTTASYSNTGLSAATTYVYTIAAYDNAGNTSAQTSAISLTTQSSPDTTAPTVSITSPSSGSVSGTITFSAIASDPTVTGAVTSGLFQLSLFIDGSVVATSSLGNLSFGLDTATLTNTSHNLTATARDNAGNSANSSAVAITVFNLSNATRYPRKLSLSGLEGLASVANNTPVTASVVAPATGAVLATASLTADASGVYTVNFQNTFPQIVSIRVAVSGHLTRLLTNIDTTVNSASVLSVPQLLAGDLNTDNTVNTLDYSLLNSHWNQNYPAADINQDGLVNSLDFAVLKNNWGKNGE